MNFKRILSFFTLLLCIPSYIFTHTQSLPIALVYFLKDSGALLRLQNKEESRKLILLTKLSLTHPTQQKGLLQFSSRPCVVRVSTFVAKSLFCATINDEIGVFLQLKIIVNEINNKYKYTTNNDKEILNEFFLLISLFSTIIWLDSILIFP